MAAHSQRVGKSTGASIFLAVAYLKIVRYGVYVDNLTFYFDDIKLYFVNIRVEIGTYQRIVADFCFNVIENAENILNAALLVAAFIQLNTVNSCVVVKIKS